MAQLNRQALGVWPVVFQSITYMAPGAAVAYSIYLSAQYAGGALTLSVVLALIGALFSAVSIGELARKIPSAGSFYTYTSKTLGGGVGFIVGFMFNFAQSLGAPFLLLIMGQVIQDTVSSYLHVTIPWYVWFLLGALFVFTLSYRGVKLSAKTGIWLGLFELLVFCLLAFTLIAKAGSHNTLSVFNPKLALVKGAGGFGGVFQGMIYCIQAFIGFEGAAALAEETKNPRNVTRAIFWSTVGIGLFYVFTTYAGTVGWGINNMSSFASNSDPWHVLAVGGWGVGWILVFLAIVNSFIANSNAATTVSTRMMFSMGRVGALPRALSYIHPTFETPSRAALAQLVWTLVLGLVCGFVLGPMNGYIMLATVTTIIMIAIYLLANLASLLLYSRQHRAEFSIGKHVIVPLLGIVFFIPPLATSVYPVPAFPANFAVPIIIIWFVLGLVFYFNLRSRNPEALLRAKDVFVSEEVSM
ncbi:APC family permease [Ferroacidibacillus organovorans]|uniref:Amino acid permease/ SLC12A domain-containing protein n=1 Tax=Ferroacidibacillus organovorans TaxID=1765683 RepID=A0A162SPP4_9BACL|nr:APC family permease [Ferroacidibacillus organovorans]KYP80037.1 hypothetical protein AYJ22_12685 [Ferroacidibacillus organovorans]OAG93072.1 hypothetical protein AYW79_12565 [Ferroacidibacillus organovorans]OPG17280.1 hypothetical protein B2M26_02845 [Ferroacidibacillus organovorans]